VTAWHRGRGTAGEPELLIAGVVLTVVGLAAAMAVASVSGLSSAVGRRRRLHEAPPPRGSVPDERHRQIETAAAR
jgi:hypothetical protein